MNSDDGVPVVPRPVPPLRPPEDVWKSGRSSLEAIEHEARRRISSPWAVLSMALVQSLMTIPYTVRYRSLLHPEGSPVNIAFALVGRSGAGKSTAAKAAELAIQWGGAEISPQTTARSGEGIPALFAQMNKTADEHAPPELRWLRLDHAAWLHWDEVGMLAAQGARTGSTVLEAVKLLTSGERLGGQNARGDGLTIPPGQYRAVLTVMVQPRRAEVLLSEALIAGGFPARFLWFAAESAAAAASPRPEHPTSSVSVPLGHWDAIRSADGLQYVDALPEMDSAHEADTRAAQLGQRDAIESRRLLNRAVVAIALANIEARSHLVPEDWDLAGAILAHSDETLERIRVEQAEPDPHELEALQRAEDVILRKVEAVRAEGLHIGHVDRRLGKKQREIFDSMKKAGRVSSF